MARLISLLCLLTPLVFAEVYYKETFDDSWADRWVQSSNRKDSGEAGDLVHTAGKWYNDAEADKGLQTSQDARFYTYSSAIETPFDSTGKDLVVQFSAKHEQQIDCGGGYIKILPEGLDQASFNGDSPYNIMFGPDICGSSTKKVHVIFNHDGKNHLIKENVPCETDKMTHVYTLIVHPDKTYEVRIDGESKREGKMGEDWDYELPKEINDPDASKPEDWSDSPMIDDPEDLKPEEWDNQPEQIDDPESTKPDDWDDEADGEFEAPMIPNPEYKGEWKAKRIDNPDYKGAWVHPQIANPDYVEVEGFGAYKSNAFVGFELWQVKAGTIFDNIFVGDSVEEAEAFLAETFTAAKEGEKKMFDDIEEEKREQEKKEREEREAKEKAEEEAAKEEEGEGGEEEEEEGEGDDEEEGENAPEEEAEVESEGHEEL